MPQSTHDRIAESDLVLPALRLMVEREDGFISTSDLIRELTAVFEPSGEDAEILKERADSRFSQKVRNLVSHKEAESSIIRNGYAVHDKPRRGLQITDEGRALLMKVSA